ERRRQPVGGLVLPECERWGRSESQNKLRRPGLGLPLVHKQLVRAPPRFASRRWCAQNPPDISASCPGLPPGGTSAPSLPDLWRGAGRILRFWPTQLQFSVSARRPSVRVTEPWGGASILRDRASSVPLVPYMFSDNKGDVVVLLVGTEALDFVDDRT